jgi:hypothetical protein
VISSFALARISPVAVSTTLVAKPYGRTDNSSGTTIFLMPASRSSSRMCLAVIALVLGDDHLAVLVE